MRQLIGQLVPAFREVMVRFPVEPLGEGPHLAVQARDHERPRRHCQPCPERFLYGMSSTQRGQPYLGLPRRLTWPRSPAIFRVSPGQ